jgi:hypothetical protein
MQKVFFASLTKVTDADDETLEVCGVASTESRDSTGEIILASAIRKALPAYRKFPAIREMHGLNAAGRAIEIDVDDDGVTHVVAKIVDANAIKKVRNKVYGGFSVGGRVLKRNAKDRTIIEEIELALVDRPAHPEARISLWKAAGLHDGAHILADDLAKITRERDGLVAQLRRREAEIAVLTGRIERMLPRIESMANELAKLRPSTGARAEAASIRQINVDDIEARTTAILKSFADLDARLQHLERGRHCDA